MIASLNLNNERKINMIPSTSTAVRAIVNGFSTSLSSPRHTVNAKYALSPMPALSAIG